MKVSHMSIKQTRMGDSNLFCRKQGGLGLTRGRQGHYVEKRDRNDYEILISLTYIYIYKIAKCL